MRSGFYDRFWAIENKGQSICRDGGNLMNKLENLIDIARLNELLGKKEEEKKRSGTAD